MKKAKKAMKFFLNYENEEIGRYKKLISKEIDKMENKEDGYYVAVLPFIEYSSKLTLGHDIDLIIKVLPSGAEGEYLIGKGTIVLNASYIKKAFEERNCISLLNNLLDTCLHECRHAWQFETKAYDFNKYISSSTNFDAYYNQAIEVDARRFALRELKIMSTETKEALLRRSLSYLYYVNR